jgi:hypothetical protein
MTSEQIERWQDYLVKKHSSNSSGEAMYAHDDMQGALASLEAALQQAKFNELLESKKVIVTLTPAVGRAFKDD